MDSIEQPGTNATGQLKGNELSTCRDWCLQFVESKFTASVGFFFFFLINIDNINITLRNYVRSQVQENF